MKKQNGITLIALIITIIVMLILVGVTVNVALNGGLFDAAKQAASGMNMAQIREKAEMAKVVLIADAETDNGVIADIPTYRDRLLEEFDVKETDTDGNTTIEVNDKYVIIIKNSDLDIEVFERTNIPPNYLLISLGYETSNIEIDEKIYGTNVAFSIRRLMDKTQYTDLKKEEAQTVSEETKKQAFLQYCYELFGAEEPFTSIDEAVVYDINNIWGYGPFGTLEEALQDETLQEDSEITTKEQFYYYFLFDVGINPVAEIESMTEQEVIDAYYEYIYSSEYSKYTTTLSLYVVKDGVQQLIREKMNTGATRPTTIDYSIGQNGTYEFILKTQNGEEIARETLRVNNIETENPYFITEAEAQVIWTTDGKGTITEYTGEDTEVIVPLIIGGENITKIGKNAFKGNTSITSVTIPKGITSIGINAFFGCSSLVNVTIPEGVESIGAAAFAQSGLTSITLPDSVTYIGESAFNVCRSLTSISIPRGVTSIEVNTFAVCNSLKEVTIPEGVSSIGENAFNDCDLIEITIPNSVTSIAENAFSVCSKLETIYFAAGDNPIPNEDLKPWGAYKGDAVQVIKLEQ